ncbi:hypothetical protein DTO013E5_8656 [Penicillium roqueforti]|nr:uncharacterized protein LCP9604111_3947 [Penicillium roqueforti]KAF9249847.1 hypothetical protein LCP9604111_3947 [Penicillium roqueforti]KAI1830470.1 hypothetical protein CBS147337_8744 [Penicillium roqueforti]KAI2697163.1 hypothetical protein CBS147372_7901 [Penicillium roqueforti]KAI2710874.1 hypothetical protein CBS147354_8454 [Penicillium roqueforti]KAI2715637.1 hypothetical protein CBS147318_6237 [Penicillium roqueforti]
MSATGAQLGSICGFSTRLSLRWVPEIPEETTDTIVLSVGEWFVDLRMDKKSGAIDWAMAGTRIEENPKEIPLKVLFTRELDSLNEIGIVDIGNFSPQADGTDLECGEMPRADLPGEPMTAFEEVWQELLFKEGPEGAKKGISWILESDDAPLAVGEQKEVTVTKVFLGRIWGTYLALQQTQTHSGQKDQAGAWSLKRSGGEVSARREEWGSGWEEKYVIGPDAGDVPSIKDGFDGEGIGAWRIPGEKVVIKGKSFIVRVFEEIH